VSTAVSSTARAARRLAEPCKRQRTGMGVPFGRACILRAIRHGCANFCRDRWGKPSGRGATYERIHPQPWRDQARSSAGRVHRSDRHMGACKQSNTPHVEDGNKGCMAGERIRYIQLFATYCSHPVRHHPALSLRGTCIADPQQYELMVGCEPCLDLLIIRSRRTAGGFRGPRGARGRLLGDAAGVAQAGVGGAPAGDGGSGPADGTPIPRALKVLYVNRYGWHLLLHVTEESSSYSGSSA